MKMKMNACLFFAFLSLWFLTGCTTTLSLQLNGQKRSEIFGHNRKVKISGGSPSGGTYSGPGVENGYFIPGKAGNGTHVITYSKMFHRKSTDTITVYGVPWSPTPCATCEGRKTIPCPECISKENAKRAFCKRCNGKGQIPCPQCANVVIDITSDEMLCEVLKVFSTCRLKLARKEHLISLSGIKYDEQSHLNPIMRFYTIDDQEIVLAPGENFKPLSPSKQEFNKTNEAVPVLFSFTKKLSLLEENWICTIELEMKYGKYDVKLFYDLRDVREDDGDLLRTYVYPRVLCFQGKFYRLPYGLFALDAKNIHEQTNGKNWRDVEECKDWHYQENTQKGYVQIIDARNFIVFSSKEASQRARNDKVWILVKEWLTNGKDDFWKTVAKKPFDKLEKALQGARR